MFRENIKHQQPGIFGLQNMLPERLHKKLENSVEMFFYRTIFCNIQEEMFEPMYSGKASRPNAPVNCLVGAIILKHKHNWSFSELFNRMEFDILTKTALGLDSLDDIPFDDATIFNFQNRLLNYQVETGINLMEAVFDTLTSEQIKALKLKTNIQRSDSLMASSNIRTYSRLQLLIEVIIRLYRVLTEEDKEKFREQFTDYTKKSSGKYIYELKASDLEHELGKIAELYHYCKKEIMANYAETEIARVFERVYMEHFTEIDDKIEVKSSDKLHSGCMQSPDDLDATYRQKRGVGYRGQSINIVETAHPDNPINLLTDVEVNPNNIDDSRVLNERIENIIAKTPDIEEIHTDGAYGSEDNDLKFEELNITHVQTAVRGRESDELMEIKQLSDMNYEVSCPLQTVKSEKTKTRFKAGFDINICQYCASSDVCPAKAAIGKRIYYFTHADFLKNRRRFAIRNLPKERRMLRPNVEASIHEFSCRLTNKKLRVRGALKTELFAFAVAIGINYGRIYRLKHGKNPLLREYLHFILKNIANTINFRFRKVIAQIISLKNINSAIYLNFCSNFMGVENGSY